MFGRPVTTIGWSRRNSTPLLVRQPHLDVVRLGRQRLLARLGRHRPQVVRAEELLGVRDVVAAEHVGLDVEQVLRDAEVGL